MSYFEINAVITVVLWVLCYMCSSKIGKQYVRYWINKHPVSLVPSVIMAFVLCMLGWYWTVILVPSAMITLLFFVIAWKYKLSDTLDSTYLQVMAAGV